MNLRLNEDEIETITEALKMAADQWQREAHETRLTIFEHTRKKLQQKAQHARYIINEIEQQQ